MNDNQLNLPFNLNDFTKNDIITKEMLIHQYYKLLHGYKNSKPYIWFQSLFIKNLSEMIPFLYIYPVEIDEDKEINRKAGIGEGLNEEDLMNFYSTYNEEEKIKKNLNTKIETIHDEKKNPFDILFTHSLVSNDKIELFVITIRCDSDFNKDENNKEFGYYEFGFLKKNNIEFLLSKKFSMDVFQKLIEIYQIMINSIINEKKKQRV